MNKLLLPAALLLVTICARAQSTGSDLEAAMDAASAMARDAAAAPPSQAPRGAQALEQGGVSGGACILPYVGLTQKGKWAVDLDGYRYEAMLAETRVSSLSMLDFSASAQEARSQLSETRQSLSLREKTVAAEVKAAGLAVDVGDLTVRKLSEGRDYRYDETCSSSAPNY